MKAIMISDKAKWCAKIMNGEKTIEVRKNKALATAIQKLINENGYADIYVCCSKINKKHYHLIESVDTDTGKTEYEIDYYIGSDDYLDYCYEGKVAFKFRCYKVEEFRPFFHWCIEKETCLTRDEVLDYLDSKDRSVGNPKRQAGKVYAIHISNLEIFDKPKELSEFKNYRKFVSYDYTYTRKYVDWELRPLNKAPQSFCYVEVE